MYDKLHTKAFVISAVEALSQGNNERAEYYLLKSLEMEPGSGRYAFLGWFYGRQNRLADAMRCFRRALRLSPEAGYLYHDFGAILMQSGYLQSSIKWFHRSLRCGHFPQKYAAFYNLAVVFNSWNRPERSLRYLNLALKCEPDFEPAARMLGDLRSQAGV